MMQTIKSGRAARRRHQSGRARLRLSFVFSCLAAACAACALGSCRVLDYGRADGGLVVAEHPWVVDGADADNGLARLGAAQNPRILATYGGEYHDAKLERMVAKIVGRLAAVSDKPNQTYRVIILDSPNINAFALPGGYVYVTRGLLALANDSAEIAAVIAHEMEHINANHGILRRDKEQEIALSDRVANEVLAGRRRDETLIRGRLKLAGFSREQELQADSAGIRMMAAAGYDPFASPRFLQAMEDYSRFRDISGAKDAGLDFLSNHPSTPQRIKLALGLARKAGAPGVGDADRDSFLRGIDGMVFGDNIHENGFFIRGQSFIDTQAGLMFTAPRGFSLSCKGNVVMAAGAGDTALRFDSALIAGTQMRASAIGQENAMRASGIGQENAMRASAIGQRDMPAPGRAHTLAGGYKAAADYIAGGWVSGLDKASVRSLTLGGLPAAQAVAQNAKWRFDVLVLVDKNRVYRFLAAAPKGGADPAAISLAAAKTFHLLSAREKAAVKPLRIRIIAAKPNDTAASLAAAMQFDDRGQELFRIINGLAPNQALRPGEKVKLVMP